MRRIVIHLDHLAEVRDRLAAVESYLAQLIQREIQVALDLSGLAREVSENADVTASAVTVIAGLRDEIVALRDQVVDPETQAALDALVNNLDANSTALADAIANTAGPGGFEDPAPEG